jgi:hypothetical protein
MLALYRAKTAGDSDGSVPEVRAQSGSRNSHGPGAYYGVNYMPESSVNYTRRSIRARSWSSRRRSGCWWRRNFRGTFRGRRPRQELDWLTKMLPLEEAAVDRRAGRIRGVYETTLAELRAHQMATRPHGRSTVREHARFDCSLRRFTRPAWPPRSCSHLASPIDDVPASLTTTGPRCTGPSSPPDAYWWCSTTPATPSTPSAAGRGRMQRVGDALVIGPAALVASHHCVPQSDDHLLEIGDDLDPPADRGRVHE